MKRCTKVGNNVSGIPMLTSKNTFGAKPKGRHTLGANTTKTTIPHGIGAMCHMRKVTMLSQP